MPQLPKDPNAAHARRAGHVMRSQTRESWLVPLLVVPLTEIALSPMLDDEDLVHRGGKHLEGRGKDLARRARTVIEAAIREKHRLTDEDALLLVEASHDLLPLSHAFLDPPGYLLVGLAIDPVLTGEPLRREIATWIAGGNQSVPLAAFMIAQILNMTKDPMGWIPRASASHAVVTRAIDQRMFDAGIGTWEQALAMAEAHWLDRGWLDLQLWQMTTKQEVEQYLSEPKQRAEAKHDADLSKEKAQRARLQASASALESEVSALRPLKDKVEGLRADAERLRLREAELVQARDRALARVQVLEEELEEVRRDVGTEPRLSKESADPPQPLRKVVYADELPLPRTLLAGRQVFFFTGEVRKSSAEAAAESLRELGAEDIRAFCLHKGSDGPDSFPASALVVVDIRFVGHSQSGSIANRAERSKAQYLAVRSGKGSLARTVAAALLQ
jgi:hypothetical protein